MKIYCNETDFYSFILGFPHFIAQFPFFCFFLYSANKIKTTEKSKKEKKYQTINFMDYSIWMGSFSYASIKKEDTKNENNSE